MTRAVVTNVKGIEYIIIPGLHPWDTQLMFKVDEAYDILKKSLDREETKDEDKKQECLEELVDEVNRCYDIIDKLMEYIDVLQERDAHKPFIVFADKPPVIETP